MARFTLGRSFKHFINLWYNMFMEDVEKAIQQERRHLDFVRAENARRAVAEAASLNANRLLEKLLWELTRGGLPLRDAVFIPTESRHRIAGLVSSCESAKVAKQGIPRVIESRHNWLGYGSGVRFMHSDFVDGWLVTYPAQMEVWGGNSDSPSYEDDSARIIVTPNFRIMSAIWGDRSLTPRSYDRYRSRPLDDILGKFKSSNDDVVYNIAQLDIPWVEPQIETYQ
jgi:hypothetical protein